MSRPRRSKVRIWSKVRTSSTTALGAGVYYFEHLEKHLRNKIVSETFLQIQMQKQNVGL